MFTTYEMILFLVLYIYIIYSFLLKKQSVSSGFASEIYRTLFFGIIKGNILYFNKLFLFRYIDCAIIRRRLEKYKCGRTYVIVQSIQNMMTALTVVCRLLIFGFKLKRS